jgi:hypothetical protein
VMSACIAATAAMKAGAIATTTVPAGP